MWWQELARVSLSSPATTLSTGTFATKKYLKIQVQGTTSGGTLGLALTFNNDTGANYNYAVLYNSSGSAVFTAAGSQTKMQISTTFVSGGAFSLEIPVSNSSSSNKILNLISTGDITNTATGYAPSLEIYAGKWVNTSNQITRIDIIKNTGTGNLGTGSEIVVLGHN